MRISLLYHDFAESMPIIDYHSHLDPRQLSNDHMFENLTQIWLQGDHYKWRAMRALGVAEEFITGNADDLQKFGKWASTVPHTLRNPLFHWTHLELKRYFGVNELLNEKSANHIYEHCNEKLQTPEYSTQALIRKMNVEVVCTTDDPIDDLSHHQSLNQQNCGFKMLPTFRPDRCLLIERADYIDYIAQLAASAQMEINTFDHLLEALHKRIAYFHEMGCRLSDHGLEQVYAEDFDHQLASSIFQKRINNQPINRTESRVFSSALLHQLGLWYAKQGWAMQLHLGALRNNNQRQHHLLGADTGFDSIGDWPQAQPLSRFLSNLDQEQLLPKTILYNLNPSYNEVLATMIGNFNDGSTKGKMQFGSAWWFLDQKDGMEAQLNTLSNMGLLSCFVGMLTDSRSFLSYPRHEYFRRILCNLLGRDVHAGLLPHDEKWLGNVVQGICYHNAKDYFKF